MSSGVFDEGPLLPQLGMDGPSGMGKRIFEAELSTDGERLVLTEACDMYFDVALRKREAQQLVDELQALVNRMPDEDVLG